MMTYFEKVKQIAPLGLTDRQISDDLNHFEMRLFAQRPWALDLPEDEQNEMILRLYWERHTIQ